MGGLLQLPQAPWSTRRADPLRAALGKENLGQRVTEVLRPYTFCMVGAPRFELGTPCTPCKCATRLRHAPIYIFVSSCRRAVGEAPRGASMIRRFWGNSAAASAPQDLH